MRPSPFCLALALALTWACGSPPPPAPPPAPRPAPPPPAPWARFAEVSAWPSVGEPFANLGHSGAGEVAVLRVSPDAQHQYEALVRDSVLPDGAIVALFHRGRANARPGPIYVMEKAGGSWRYLELTALGVPAPGSTTACQGCHLGAVGDSLFGIPRP